MVINSNPISPSYFNQINQVNQTLESGRQINSAAENPAGSAIVSALTAQVNSRDIATQNANQGIGLLQTADGASNSIGQALLRMNELALQAQNGTLNDEQRGALNAEFQQNIQSINQTAQNTAFNGQSLLNGQSPSVNINLGDSSNSTLTLPNQSSDGLAISGLNIGNAADASLAFAGVTNALEQLTTQRGEFGAQQNGLVRAIDNLASQNINSQASRSQISDTDFARAMTEKIRQQTLNESSIAMQAQSNQTRGNVLQLLSF